MREGCERESDGIRKLLDNPGSLGFNRLYKYVVRVRPAGQSRQSSDLPWLARDFGEPNRFTKRSRSCRTSKQFNHRSQLVSLVQQWRVEAAGA